MAQNSSSSFLLISDVSTDSLNQGIKLEMHILDLFNDLNEENFVSSYQEISNLLKSHKIGFGLIDSGLMNAIKIRPLKTDLYDKFFRQIISDFGKVLSNISRLDDYIKVPMNSYEKIMRNDDIEQLQNLASSPSFDFNMKINAKFSQRNKFTVGSKVSTTENYFSQIIHRYGTMSQIPLISVAAHYGAVKCFKYLVLNDVQLPENIVQDAVAGGNTEIIHYLENKQLSFENEYITAIEYQHNEIADWILSHYGQPDLEFDEQEAKQKTFFSIYAIKPSFRYMKYDDCLLAYNIRAFFYLCKKYEHTSHADNFVIDSCGFEYGFSYLSRYILTSKRFIFTKQIDAYELTAFLKQACKNGDMELITFLIKAGALINPDSFHFLLFIYLMIFVNIFLFISS